MGVRSFLKGIEADVFEDLEDSMSTMAMDSTVTSHARDGQMEQVHRNVPQLQQADRAASVANSFKTQFTNTFGRTTQAIQQRQQEEARAAMYEQRRMPKQLAAIKRNEMAQANQEYGMSL